RLDVASAHGRQHLGGADRHVAAECEFVFSPFGMNLEHRDSPGVAHFRIEFHEIAVVGQALAVSIKPELPRPGTAERFLELGAEAGLCDAALPAFPVGLSLKAVSAQELALLRLHIPEA